MLNDEQTEIAAREYCRILGSDPDRMVFGAHEEHPTLAVSRPQWQEVAKQVRATAAMQAAIAKACAA